jgi:hypothetical protein
MKKYSWIGVFSRLSIGFMFLLIFALTGIPARAADSLLTIGIDFGYDQFGIGAYKEFDAVPLGKSFRLNISLYNLGPNPIRIDSLKCSQTGSSLSASSISRLPNTVVLAPNTYFQTEQYYRTISPGLSEVTCLVTGTDTVTHTSLSAEPIRIASLMVSGETRLYFNVSSATHNIAPVGQKIYIMAVYGNRGPTTLTNVTVECGPGNHGFSIRLNRQTQTTLPPGQSGFAEFVAVAGLPGAGAVIKCSITADDSATGAKIGLSSTPLLFRTP